MITDEIIHSCQNGDRHAQHLIYQELSVKMFCVSLRYAPSRSVAQDWLHDGFIHLFKNITSYRGEGSFEGWARRVFVTTALTNIRREKGWFDRSMPVEDLLSHSQSDIASALQTMESAEILKAINNLAPLHRAVLNLFSIEGYTHDEIASMLGISSQNSRTILHRAKNELSIILKKEGIIE